MIFTVVVLQRIIGGSIYRKVSFIVMSFVVAGVYFKKRLLGAKLRGKLQFQRLIPHTQCALLRHNSDATATATATATAVLKLLALVRCFAGSIKRNLITVAVPVGFSFGKTWGLLCCEDFQVRGMSAASNNCVGNKWKSFRGALWIFKPGLARRQPTRRGFDKTYTCGRARQLI